MVLSSTAASHQRSFVVKVMGRNCGYLALMGALASGADWVLIPECPPQVDNWEEVMCENLIAGRKAGRRKTIVVMAEGSRDRNGNPDHQRARPFRYLKRLLAKKCAKRSLGHVQRGGAPSAFDRNLGTLVGNAAVETLLSETPENEPQLIGFRGNFITHSPLMECVEKNHTIVKAIENKSFDTAMELRGSNFKDILRNPSNLVSRLASPTLTRSKTLETRHYAFWRSRSRNEHGRPGCRADWSRQRPSNIRDPEWHTRVCKWRYF